MSDRMHDRLSRVNLRGGLRNDRTAINPKSTRNTARRRALWRAHGRVLAGPGSFDDDRRGGRCRMDLARPTIPLSGNLQGQNRLPLGWRELSARGTFHKITNQAGADGMGAA